MRKTKTRYPESQGSIVKCIGTDRDRFILKIYPADSLEPQNFDALFIGLNPSIANAENSDITTNYCMKIAKEEGWKSIAICNLISFIDPVSSNINEEWFKYLDINIDYLESTIGASDNIVAFWGNRAENIDGKYRKKIFSLLENRLILTISFTDKGFPTHLANRNHGKRKLDRSQQRNINKWLVFEKQLPDIKR